MLIFVCACEGYHVATWALYTETCVGLAIAKVEYDGHLAHS